MKSCQTCLFHEKGKCLWHEKSVVSDVALCGLVHWMEKPSYMYEPLATRVYPWEEQGEVSVQEQGEVSPTKE